MTTPQPLYTLDDCPAAEWEMVTPTMAKEALQHMRKNRPLREPRVTSLMNDIENGDWQKTGEAIQQGDDGLWDNGQHRFHAIVRTGIAVPILVVRGIGKPARVVIDTGAARKYGDTLSMRNTPNAQVAASIIRKMWLWDVSHRYMGGGVKVHTSHQMLDAYYADNKSEIDKASTLSSEARKCWLSPSILGTIFILLRRVDPVDASEFLESLITGAIPGTVEEQVLDPRYVLRGKLRGLYERGEDDGELTRAWVFLAWNMWRDGRRVTKLQPPRGGTSRQPFTDKNYPLPR